MSELVNAYRAAWQSDVDGPAAQPPALESALVSLCARGRAAHGDLDLDDLTFVAHLARCGAPVTGDVNAVHAEDLFVACAALNGNAAAVEKLRRAHRGTIAAHLHVIETASASIEEVEQRLWEALLVGGADRAPRLATFSGRGRLGAFLGVAAQRLVLDGRRHRSAEQRAMTGMAAEVQAVANDAELAFIKVRYREGFQGAIQDALGRLEARERMLLRMHVVDGLTFDRIAKVYGVTQPTVSRWVAKARDAVLAETRRLLRERMLLSESEFESLAGLLVSQLDFSVSRVLRHSR